MKVDVSKVVRKYAIIIVLIVLIAVFSFLSPAFATFKMCIRDSLHSTSSILRKSFRIMYR